MSKYEKMVSTVQEMSRTKIKMARQAIDEMVKREEKISVTVLVKKTGLSRGFFYKNPEIRMDIIKAKEKEKEYSGRKKYDRPVDEMIHEIDLLRTLNDSLQHENSELKKQVDRLEKRLDKRELSFLKKL